MDYLFVSVVMFFALALLFMFLALSVEFPINTIMYFLSFLFWLGEGLLFLIGMGTALSPYVDLAPIIYLMFFFLAVVNFTFFIVTAISVFRQSGKDKRDEEDSVRSYGTSKGRR
jgi:hypothetical protein